MPDAPSNETRRVDELHAALTASLAPDSLEIVDESARHAGHAGAREGGHFRIRIVAGAFAGQSTIERHRLVYGAVADLMGRSIHALSIEAHSPSEKI